VKKVIRKCVTCNKVEGMPYATVSPPSLPGYQRTYHFGTQVLTMLVLFMSMNHLLKDQPCQRLMFVFSPVTPLELYI